MKRATILSTILVCFGLLARGQTEVEPNNSLGQANPLAESTDISGEIGDCTTFDNSYDYFAITPAIEGVMRIYTSISNDDVTDGTVTIQVLQSSGGLDQALSMQSGGNGVPIADQADIYCQGIGTYYIRVHNPSNSYCTSYTLSYEMIAPVYAADPEPNNSPAEAISVAQGVDQDGRHEFQYQASTYDIYRLDLLNDGVLNIDVDAEHADAGTGETMTLQLLNTSGGLLEAYVIQVGENSTPASNSFSYECAGNDQHYFLRFQSSTTCGVSYRFSYDVSGPVFAQDVEPNNSGGQALPVAMGVQQEGRLGFNYEDDTHDYYQLSPTSDGILNIQFEAEHVDASATDMLTLQLLNSSSGLLKAWSVPIGASSTPVSTLVSEECLGDGDIYYLRVHNGSWCGVSYKFSYFSTTPLYGADVEPNDGLGQALTLAPNTNMEGRLGFYYEDEAYDYYEISVPDDGVINLTVSAEHSGATTGDQLVVQLLNSSGGLLDPYSYPIGASGTPITTTYTSLCRGTEDIFYVRMHNGSWCGVSYQVSYSITPPVFGDDNEPNDGIGDAQSIDLEMAPVNGRMQFYYDFGTYDIFEVTLAVDDKITINSNAEHAGATPDDLTLQLLNSSGGSIDFGTLPIGANSIPASGFYESAILTAGTYYVRLNSPICGVSYEFECYDDDADGTCNFFDLCPGGPEPGTPCDDLSTGTSNDVIQPDCSCAGTDCNGDIGGTATLDNCGVCSGGNTGLTPNADEDCNGDCFGTAAVDNCGVCAGGNTGLTPNANEDCNGDCFGTAAVDNCGVCAGGNTGLTPNADEDCNGDCFGSAAVDNCGVCAGGNTGLTPNADEDCNGDCFGTAFIDNCGDCVGGNTGLTPCTVDCNGDPGGTAIVDNCGVCAGGNTGLTPNADEDCNGDCFGTAALDNCGVCAGGNTGLTPNADEDCNGDCFGTAFVDGCGDCVGGNTGLTPCSVDCNGDPGGTAMLDNCGVCAGGNTGLTPNVDEDCNGDCFGTAALDNCGVCAGGNTGLTPNADEDCNGDCFGTAAVDNCGVCAGGSTGLTPDVDEDCNGDCFGSATVDNCGVCAGGNTGLTPNADEDCEGTCFGSALPGTPCDDGNANTTNDMWTAGCSCEGTPIGGCTEDLSLILNTDGAGSETSWQIIPQGGGAPLCSGSGYADNSTIVVGCCVPVGCYQLEVFDSFGDGMTTGGYILQDENGQRIIDNSLNGAGFTTLSALANNGGFCLPISSNRIIDNIANPAYGCDNLSYSTSDYFVAKPDPAVNANNGDGYQFWMMDPNGTYSRRVFQTGNINNGWPNSDPNDACYLRFAWLQSNPVPADLHLNIRVRVKINGTYNEFGPACLALIESTVTPCTTTRLVDDPNNPLYSCDVVRGFGVGDKVYAYPVSGANKYQFRFENMAEGFARNISSTNNTRVLNWLTSPLQSGINYDVKVRISYDNGANWCPFGPSCVVSIVNPPTVGRDVTAIGDEASMLVWPNPHRDGPLYLKLEMLSQEETEVQMDIFDKFGKRIATKTYTSSDRSLNTTIELDDLATGVYVLNVIAGEDHFTETVIIQ